MKRDICLNLYILSSDIFYKKIGLDVGRADKKTDRLTNIILLCIIIVLAFHFFKLQTTVYFSKLKNIQLIERANINSSFFGVPSKSDNGLFQ